MNRSAIAFAEKPAQESRWRALNLMTGSRLEMANLIRSVRHTICGLDVVQGPSSPSFRYELPAQNLSSS